MPAWQYVIAKEVKYSLKKNLWPPRKLLWKKDMKIQGGGQEMAVMVD